MPQNSKVHGAPQYFATDLCLQLFVVKTESLQLFPLTALKRMTFPFQTQHHNTPAKCLSCEELPISKLSHQAESGYGDGDANIWIMDI